MQVMLWPSQMPVPQAEHDPTAVEQGVPARGRVAGHPAGAGAVQVRTLSPCSQSQRPSG